MPAVPTISSVLALLLDEVAEQLERIHDAENNFFHLATRLRERAKEIRREASSG